jgi:hypothetical protein
MPHYHTTKKEATALCPHTIPRYHTHDHDHADCHFVGHKLLSIYHDSNKKKSHIVINNRKKYTKQHSGENEQKNNWPLFGLEKMPSLWSISDRLKFFLKNTKQKNWARHKGTFQTKTLSKAQRHISHCKQVRLSRKIKSATLFNNMCITQIFAKTCQVQSLSMSRFPPFSSPSWFDGGLGLQFCVHFLNVFLIHGAARQAVVRGELARDVPRAVTPWVRTPPRIQGRTLHQEFEMMLEINCLLKHGTKTARHFNTASAKNVYHTDRLTGYLWSKTYKLVFCSLQSS